MRLKMTLQERMEEKNNQIYKNDLSLLKKYIGCTQGTDIVSLMIKNYKTKNYSFTAFLDLFKEEFYKDSYFDFYKFRHNLWRSIEKGNYSKFLDDFIIQEKTGESKYFSVHHYWINVYCNRKEPKHSIAYSTNENRESEYFITPEQFRLLLIKQGALK